MHDYGMIPFALSSVFSLSENYFCAKALGRFLIHVAVEQVAVQRVA